jgi:hypothetical protein
MRKNTPIENGARHSYIRRVPTGNEARRYRYVYDPGRAVRTFSQPQIGEKIRIAHGTQPGHYEVIKFAKDDVVEVIHDETGHRMMIATSRLHDLLSDTYAARAEVGTLDALMAKHLREDRLPRAKWRVFDAIVDASGIDDTEFADADRAYLRWRRGQGPKPKRRAGSGQLDSFEGDLRRGRHFTSLREAFDDATKGAQTWRDVMPALLKLREVPGFEHARFPDEVLGRHTAQDLELHDFESVSTPAVLNIEHYGSTIAPGASADDEAFAVFDAWVPTSRKDREARRAAAAADVKEVEEIEEIEDAWGGVPFPNPFDPQTWIRYRQRIDEHRTAAQNARIRARYDLEALDEARAHDAEARRLEAELAAWRAGPGADDPPRGYVPYWKRPRR